MKRQRSQLGSIVLRSLPFCVAGVLYLFAEPRAILLGGGIVATAVYASLIICDDRENEIVLTPLTVYQFWYWLVLGVTPIYMALRFPDYESLQFMGRLVSMPEVATGYILTLLGACCLLFGVLCGLPARTKTVDSGQFIEPGSLAVHTVFLCCLVSILYERYSGSLLFLGSTVGYLLGDIGPAAVCIYAIGKRSKLLEEWDKLFVLLPVTILLILAQGGHGAKSGFVSASIPLLWFFLIDRRRRKLLLVFGPIAAAAYIFWVTPAVTLARENVGTAHVTPAAIIDASRRQMVNFNRDPQTYLRQWSDGVALRIFIEPIAVGFIVNRVEAEGYTYGKTLDYLIWASVPRVLWKDKPVVTRGGWFTSKIGASVTEGSATTSTGMTSPGELYWNFGWFGVIVGMWLLGFLISRLLWRLALPDPSSSLVTMLPYVHVLMNFMGYQDSEAGSSALNIIQAYLLFLIVAKIATSLSLKRQTTTLPLRYLAKPTLPV